MPYLIYRDHTIISAAVYDDITGKWRLTASVSWSEGGRQYLHFINDNPERFSRIEDAESAAMETAKSWVDANCRKAVAS
jgi:hypothetical protein